MKNNFLFQKLGLSASVIGFCLPILVSSTGAAQTTSAPVGAVTAATPTPAPIEPTTGEVAAPIPLAPPEALSPTAGKVERVEVIGTRIKRIAIEGISPVKIVTGEEIAKSGNLTVADGLRESTSATFGMARERSGYNAAASATIGLRGLGADRTLVLLNGRRLPKDPSLEAVDLNLIPPSAIERVETLKDGASAIYGSDALGGVINIVTKKGFNGNELQTMFVTPQRKGGSKFTTALTTGTSSEKSDFLMVVNLTRTDKVITKDRPLTEISLSQAGPIGSYQDAGGVWRVNPNEACPPELIITNNSGSKCYYNAAEVASASPSISSLNLLTDYTYRMPNSLQFYNRNLVVMKDINWNYAPSVTPGQGFILPAGTPNLPAARKILYRFKEAGNRDNTDTERNLSTVFGLKGYAKGTWEWDASIGYGRIQRENAGLNGYLDSAVLLNLIKTGVYDPFGTPGAKGDISTARLETFVRSETTILSADVTFSGEIGEMSGGAMGAAIGASSWSESLSQRSDSKTLNGEVLGSAGSNVQGDRQVSAVFAEVTFPITEKFEIDIAGRADHYSDFGTTFNPKIGAKYNVNPQVLIRSSIGTGYRAPSIVELYSARSAGYLTLRDDVLCKADPTACDPSSIYIVSGGNRDLKEEKAITASAGIVYEPHDNFSTSVDFWGTKMDNVVGVDLEEAIKVEAAGQSLTPYGIIIERDPITNEIIQITSPNLNLSTLEVAGADWQIQAGLMNNLWGHRLTFVNDFAYMLYSKSSGFPGAEKKDTLGSDGLPRFKNNATLNLQNEKFAYSLTLRTIPGTTKESNPDDRYKDSHEFDFAAVYTLSKATSFTGGIKNLFDAEAPNDPSGGVGGSPYVNTSLYDISGRRFFVGFNQTF